jgi:hypothetical protein
MFVIFKQAGAARLSAVRARFQVTTLRYALIGMAALAALELYAMMVGGGTANG